MHYYWSLKLPLPRKGARGAKPPDKKEKYSSDCGFCRKHRSDWNLANITYCAQVGNEGWLNKYEIFGVTGGAGVGVTIWAPVVKSAICTYFI